MDFNIINLIIDSGKQSLMPALISAFAAIGSYMTAVSVQKQNLFSKRMEHYKQLQDVIKEFYLILPTKWIDKEKKYRLEQTKINKSEECVKKIKFILYNLDLLQTEAKYLFESKDVSIFEKDFYNFIYLSQKLFDINEEVNWVDSIEEKMNPIIERIKKRNDIFDRDLNISTSLVTKIKRLLVKDT